MRQIARIKSAIIKELAFFFSLPAILWQVIFFYMPLLIIVWLSFIKLGYGNQLLFTLENYTALLHSVYARIILRSFGLATFTTIACLLVAYPCAYFIALKMQRARHFLFFMLIVPFWTNFLIHVYAWFFILDRNGLVNTMLMKLGIIHTPLHLANNTFSVCLVSLYCYLPFMIMPLYSILESFNKQLLEASLDLGASSWQTFFRVTIPLSLPGIRTGCFLVFVPAFGEFVIPALLGGGKYMYVGTLIAHYFLTMRDLFAGSAFTVLAGIALLVVIGLFYRWLRKKP